VRIGNFASVLCLAALAAAAGGCAVADTGAFVRLQEEMEGIKKEVAAIKGTGTSPPSFAGRAETGDLSAVQRNVADLTASQDQVKSDILAATTRADEAKVQMQKDISRLNDKSAEQGQALQPALHLRWPDFDTGVGRVRARGQGQPQMHGTHRYTETIIPDFFLSYKK